MTAQPGQNTASAPSLGFWALVAYGLAYIAPTAPFAVIGVVWNAAHGLVALCYLFGGLCMYFTGQSYATMAREVRSAGSVYGFARHALGPLAGFVAGWLILLDYLLIPAFIYVIMSVALEQLFPGVDRMVWILAISGSNFCVNWFGVQATSRVNFATVVLQVIMVVVVLGLALWALAKGAGAGRLGAAPFWNHDPALVRNMLAGTSICVMSYLGFDAISCLSEDTSDQTGRTMGRAILAVLAIATMLFVAMAWIFGNLMVNVPFADPAAATYEVMGHTIGRWVVVPMAWSTALVVGFTNVLPMQVSVAKVLFAMARDRQLPAILTVTHKRYDTPWVAMVFSTLISVTVAVVLRNSVDQLTSMVNFGALGGFFMLHLAVLALFVGRRGSRKFTHLVTPVLGMLVVLGIFSGMNSLALKIGGGWMLAGLSYAIYLARVKPGALASEGAF